MSRLLIFSLIFLFLAGCGESGPPFIDNGNPGQIKAIVFYDENLNGQMDDGEVGVQTRVAVTQQISCPPTNKPTYYETDANGVYMFEGLKPGKYCVVSESGGFSMTTKLTPEVYVSSDLITVVYFGRGENP